MEKLRMCEEKEI